MVFIEFLKLHATVGVWILGLMTLLWILSLILKDSSIVDIFWGAGFCDVSVGGVLLDARILWTP